MTRAGGQMRAIGALFLVGCGHAYAVSVPDAGLVIAYSSEADGESSAYSLDCAAPATNEASGWAVQATCIDEDIGISLLAAPAKVQVDLMFDGLWTMSSEDKLHLTDGQFDIAEDGLSGRAWMIHEVPDEDATSDVEVAWTLVAP
jgi:hypothetical protein